MLLDPSAQGSCCHHVQRKRWFLFHSTESRKAEQLVRASGFPPASGLQVARSSPEQRNAQSLSYTPAQKWGAQTRFLHNLCRRGVAGSADRSVLSLLPAVSLPTYTYWCIKSAAGGRKNQTRA